MPEDGEMGRLSAGWEDGVLTGRRGAGEKQMGQRSGESRPESWGERTNQGPRIWAPGEGSWGLPGFVPVKWSLGWERCRPGRSELGREPSVPSSRWKVARGGGGGGQ